mgnify:CR=1 FL=1
MHAAVATVFDADNPVVGLKVGEHEGKAQGDGQGHVQLQGGGL